jgi:hypothetical protein
MLALVLAALAVHVPRLGAQVFARAAWWASVGLGALIVLVEGSGSDVRDATAYLVPSALALVVIGRRGIAEAEERSGHVASAFRSSLLLLMVLALADAQTFTVFGLVGLDRYEVVTSVVLFCAAAALMIGFVGLFRLALWGALVNLVACIAVFLLSLERGIHLREELLVLSGLHVVVAAPVVIASTRGKSLPTLPAAARAIGVNVVLLTLVALSVSRCVLR